MKSSGKTTIEAEPEAEQRWVQQVHETAETSLCLQANTWYLGADVPEKPRIFMPFIGGFSAYVDICTEVADKGYEGFQLS